MEKKYFLVDNKKLEDAGFYLGQHMLHAFLIIMFIQFWITIAAAFCLSRLGHTISASPMFVLVGLCFLYLMVAFVGGIMRQRVSDDIFRTFVYTNGKLFMLEYVGELIAGIMHGGSAIGAALKEVGHVAGGQLLTATGLVMSEVAYQSVISNMQNIEWLDMTRRNGLLKITDITNIKVLSIVKNKVTIQNDDGKMIIIHDIYTDSDELFALMKGGVDNA